MDLQKKKKLKKNIQTDSVVKFTIPLVRDNGTIQSVYAYRAHHKRHLLPNKGGTRYAPNISLEVILSFILILKNTVTSLLFALKIFFWVEILHLINIFT